MRTEPGLPLHRHLPLTNRVVANGTPLDDRFTNVALEARAAGYDPVLFGYTDVSVDPRGVAPDDPRLFSYEGVLPGFDAVVDFRSQTLQPWIDWLVGAGLRAARRRGTTSSRADADLPGRGRPRAELGAAACIAAEHSDTAYLTDRLLAWLRTQGGATPWFAHLSYLRPHPPYRVPAPYHDRYDPDDVAPPVRAPTPRRGAVPPAVGHGRPRPRGGRAPDDDAELRQITATYYGMMAEVDDHLGRVLDWLDQSGQADDTLVVLTSDHGDQMGDHWLMEKLGWWDESYHVPLIVRDPRVGPAAGAGGSTAFTEHVDVMPTVLEWLGLPVPRQCDGRSLGAFVATRCRRGWTDWRTEAHWQWDFSRSGAPSAETALRPDQRSSARWTCCGASAGSTCTSPGCRPLLFDLVEDPISWSTGPPTRRARRWWPSAPSGCCRGACATPTAP